MIDGDLVRGLMCSYLNIVHDVSLRMSPVGRYGNSGGSLRHTMGLILVLVLWYMAIVNE